jgi:hypothetical protein
MLFPQKKIAAKGNLYKRPETRAEYQLFSEDYFSSADVNIYFGKIWVEEIVGLQFQLAEQTMPIYGYNSFVFDHVARGKRMISGSFTINFTRTGYLQKIIENEELIQLELVKANQKKSFTENDFKKYKLEEILKKSGKDFDLIASKMENAIWGIEENTEISTDPNKNPYFFQSNEGFDIKITYGAKEQEEGYKIQMMKNLQKQYGPNVPKDKMEQALSSYEKPNTTVEVLNGVHLMGFTKNSMQTGSDGVVITETYNFIARDFNSTLRKTE